MFVQTYLHFDGRCEEAIEFYRKALDAQVGMLLRYKDSPEPPPPGMVPSGWDDKVMHSEFRVGDSVVMASDDCTGKHAGFQGFQLSITVADEAEAERREQPCRPAARCECRSRRPFSPRASACSATATASAGW
jgi:PhnB protein